jgi:hypothetical protein
MKSFWLKSLLTEVVLLGSTAEGLVVIGTSDVEGKQTDIVGSVELIGVMAVLLPLQLFSDN